MCKPFARTHVKSYNLRKITRNVCNLSGKIDGDLKNTDNTAQLMRNGARVDYPFPSRTRPGRHLATISFERAPPSVVRTSPRLN